MVSRMGEMIPLAESLVVFVRRSIGGSIDRNELGTSRTRVTSTWQHYVQTPALTGPTRVCLPSPFLTCTIMGSNPSKIPRQKRAELEIEPRSTGENHAQNSSIHNHNWNMSEIHGPGTITTNNNNWNIHLEARSTMTSVPYDR